MDINNKKKDNPHVFKSSWPGLAAAGLLISDTSQGRMAIFSLLCSSVPHGSANMGGGLVPDLARRGEAMALRRTAEREMRPIVGELLHFARSSPGGVPVREVTNSHIPAVAVIKKVAEQDWELAVESSRALFDAAEHVFAPNLRRRASETLTLFPKPGDLEGPELREFSSHIERQLLALQSARLAIEKDLKRGPHP